MITALAVLAWESALEIRIGQVDLTPSSQLPLGGYTARANAISQPGGDALKARIITFQQRGQRVALVACDLLTIPASLYGRVQTECPGTQVVLVATHTHCAPDSQMLNTRMTLGIPGISNFRQEWLDWYTKRLVDGVRLVGQSKPISYKALSLNLSHSDSNRARRWLGDPDQSFTQIKADQRTILAAYAAHGTLFGDDELKTRGDWPGALAERLGCPVVPGAIGDVSPKSVGRNPAEQVAYMVRTLLDTRPVTTLPMDSSVELLQEPIVMDLTEPHPSFAKRYGIPPAFAKQIVSKFAEPKGAITALRIGNAVFLGVPGEPTSHLGRELRDFGASLGFSRVVVLSHVNGWMGYILGPEDYDRGGYEATLAFYGRGGGAKFVDAGKVALRRLRDLGRFRKVLQ